MTEIFALQKVELNVQYLYQSQEKEDTLNKALGSKDYMFFFINISKDAKKFNSTYCC